MSEKKRRWKRDSLFYPLFGVLCLALLCVTLVLHFTTQDRAYSAKEKRGLSQLPKLSFESLVDGSFMKGMEDYAADQFPLRDSWMRLKMNVSLLAGQRESEGVYYAKDGTLMEGFSPFDEALMEKNAAAINHFNEQYGLKNAWFLLAPTAVGIYPEQLPSHADCGDQLAYVEEMERLVSSSCTVLDVSDVLLERKEKWEENFYRTDHHWTTDAAFCVFEKNAERAGWKVGTYDRGVVCNTFNGSLSSKSGFSPRILDNLVIYRNADEEASILVTHDAANTSFATCFDFEALEGDNPYEVFFGGNEPMINILTTADTNRSLLVFKDSFANCFLPFLTDSYKSITVIDPRYYTDPISTLFLQYEFTDVMYLYNANTLSTDENLWMVLSE